ncbi:MAG TPA: hypothetical protein PLP23_22160 [Panacibacter sp.]|nr:hypothetical protein [Panacibacter sp.]
MKYQVGDEIVVLHTNEEGRVTEIINDKMVMIEVRGVKFPSYMDQIDFPYFKRFTQNKAILQPKKEKKFVEDVHKEKSKPSEVKVAEGVWLSLIPKFATDDFGDEMVELFKLHLVNKTPRGYKFIYEQQALGDIAFELTNEITGYHDFYLHDIKFSDFNDNPILFFEFSLLTPDKKKADYFETSLKLKGKQIFQRVEEMKQKNEPTVTFKLFENYPDKTFDTKPKLSPYAANEYAVYEAKQARKNLEPARSVIDLHMEKLSDNWQHMSNFEILTLQLKEFEKWYNLSVAHRQENLIVIHGVGSGKLRDEIHDILKSKKEVRFFINQYDHRFGYGATEIFFQY